MAKIKWFIKKRIQLLYMDGFTVDELSLMYDISEYRVKKLLGLV